MDQTNTPGCCFQQNYDGPIGHGATGMMGGAAAERDILPNSDETTTCESLMRGTRRRSQW